MVTYGLTHVSARRPFAGGREFLPPPLAPARLCGVDDLILGELAGDEGSLVAVQVPEARVAQCVGCYPGREIQPPPQLDHLRRRAEPGLPRVLLAEPLPRLPAGPAQLVGGECLFRGVAGQLPRGGIFAVR